MSEHLSMMPTLDLDHPAALTPASIDLQAAAETRNLGMVAHLSALAGLVCPFGNLIGPLLMWKFKSPGLPFVEAQAKEALNFQVCVTIAVLLCVPLMFIGIGMLVLPLVGLAALAMTVFGAMQAKQGRKFRYPFVPRLIK